VELSSRNPVSISAQTLQVNAAAGFSVTGSSAQVSSPSISVSSIEGVTFTGNTVDVVSNQGQIIANAGNENTFHSTDTLTVISDHGNVNVAANNANNVNAQSFTLVGGNSQFNDAVSFGGNSLLDVHAAYDFWLRSQGTFVGSSSQDVQIFSDNGEVIVEAQLDLNASASADAQFVSQVCAHASMWLARSLGMPNLTESHGITARFDCRVVARSHLGASRKLGRCSRVQRQVHGEQRCRFGHGRQQCHAQRRRRCSRVGR